MTYYLGCLMLSDPKTDEWFAQIVEDETPTGGFFKPAATALAIGKEAALKKVCDHLGLTETPPIAMRTEYTAHDVVQTGLLDAMKRCSYALDDLATDLAIARHYRTAGEEYEFDL